jgi:L-fucose mutarotase
VLTIRLLHPQILAALAESGHGSRVLIAAANFPAKTHRGPNATLVSLALAPGLVTCTHVLSALLTAAVFEHAAVIRPPAGKDGAESREPPAWGEYRRLLRDAGRDMELEPLEGDRFFEEARSNDVALTVATGDERRYTSVLLTVGFVESALDLSRQ